MLWKAHEVWSGGRMETERRLLCRCREEAVPKTHTHIQLPKETRFFLIGSEHSCNLFKIPLDNLRRNKEPIMITIKVNFVYTYFNINLIRTS